MQPYDRNINLSVPWFLMASYLYYHRDLSLMEDSEFDMMCKIMLDNWDTIQHYHKHLIDESMLKSGSGFNLKLQDYPSITKSAAMKLYENSKKSKNFVLDI